MDPALAAAFASLTDVTVGQLSADHPRVVSELALLHPVHAAAAFAGLLTKPELQANCLRLEALVHLALLHGGGSKVPTKGFLKRAFDGLHEGYCGRAEDPAEDVFLALVNTPQGNFRVFEGIREGNAFCLQRILDVIETMPSGASYDDLRSAVRGLLGLSEAVAERAKVLENSLGAELPFEALPAELVGDLRRLRDAVRFTNDDLLRLGINNECLAEFAFDPRQRDQLAAQTFGDTALERHPLAFIEDAMYLLLPTAVGTAITRLVIEFVKKAGNERAFEQALAASFAAVFRDTPAVGSVPLALQRIRGGQIGSLMKEADAGRFLHIVFFVDGLDGFSEGGLRGANTEPDVLAGALNELIRGAGSAARGNATFVDGLTLLVGCGYGRGLVLGLADELPAGWRLESISAHDLATLSWLFDFKLLSLWRIFEAKKSIEASGVEFLNLNGLLNLVAWALENGGHLVPHGRIPDDFVDGKHGLVVVDQNALLKLRHSVLVDWDARRVLDLDGRYVSVKKFERTYFAEDNAAPLYVSIEDLSAGRLRAVYRAPHRSWWVEIVPPEGADHSYVFEHWMLLCTWVRRVAPTLDAAYLQIPAGPLSIVVAFSEITGPTSGRTPSKNAEDLRSLVRVQAREGDRRVFVQVGQGFDDGLLQADNIAERILVEAIISGAAVVGREGGHPEKSGGLGAVICPNSEMRYMHRFEAQSFRDYVRDKVGRKPLLIDQFDHAACLIGLGWRSRSRELGAEIVGVGECTTFLNKVVENLISDICRSLRRLDRRSVVTALLRSHEAASCDRDVWRRTARANLAMHSDRDAALAVMVDHDGRLSVSFALTRILIEAALCECPPDGGRTSGELDLSRLFSLAFLVFSFGGDSDAVYWGAMEPWIRVTPLGDIFMNRSFEKNVHQPFSRVGGAVQFEHAAESYEKLYAAHPPVASVDGILEGQFLEAWRAEFGISVDGLRAVIDAIEGAGIKRNEAIVTMPNSALVELFAEAGRISVDHASKVVDLLVLGPRPQWSVPPEGFRDRDWQPWRFRRTLSVLRRPFLRLDASNDPDVAFAPGLVRDAFVATLRWFYEGNVHQSETHSAQMQSWTGHANRKNGHEFTLAVEGRLKELGWRTAVEVQLTNALGRGDVEPFGDLKKFGDIDVLAWREGSERVLAIECKDVQFQKTFGEVAEQLADFRGGMKPNGKPDLLRRHLDRIEVLSENLALLAKRFKLSPPIRLEGHLVFRNPVPMKYAWDQMASRVKLSVFGELNQI
jgi:hypothetical protein